MCCRLREARDHVEEERECVADRGHVTREPTEDRALLRRDCQGEHDQRQDAERMRLAERAMPGNGDPVTQVAMVKST